jgi:hypothetical protein
MAVTQMADCSPGILGRLPRRALQYPLGRFFLLLPHRAGRGDGRKRANDQDSQGKTS